MLKYVRFIKEASLQADISVCVWIACAPVCVCVCVSLNLRVCVLSEAAQGRGSDIEDGLNPVLHSSGRPEFIRVRIIPPQDQRKCILNKSSCWGENTIVRVKLDVYVCVKEAAK